MCQYKLSPYPFALSTVEGLRLRFHTVWPSEGLNMTPVRFVVPRLGLRREDGGIEVNEPAGYPIPARGARVQPGIARGASP